MLYIGYIAIYNTIFYIIDICYYSLAICNILAILVENPFGNTLGTVSWILVKNIFTFTFNDIALGISKMGGLSRMHDYMYLNLATHHHFFFLRLSQ